MDKPGDFGGFHIVNIDDTIEIQSKELEDAIKSKSYIELVSSTDDDHSNKVNVYLTDTSKRHIIFEIFGDPTMMHYHIFPGSLEYLKGIYKDIVKDPVY